MILTCKTSGLQSRLVTGDRHKPVSICPFRSSIEVTIEVRAFGPNLVSRVSTLIKWSCVRHMCVCVLKTQSESPKDCVCVLIALSVTDDSVCVEDLAKWFFWQTRGFGVIEADHPTCILILGHQYLRTSSSKYKFNVNIDCQILTATLSSSDKLTDMEQCFFSLANRAEWNTI